jgi:ribosomal protein S6
MSILRKYEIMILLTEEFNDSELKTWVFNYAKNLRKFNVCDISVISRGKHNLSYSINNCAKRKLYSVKFFEYAQVYKQFFKYFKIRFECCKIFSL